MVVTCVPCGIGFTKFSVYTKHVRGSHVDCNPELFTVDNHAPFQKCTACKHLFCGSGLQIHLSKNLACRAVHVPIVPVVPMVVAAAFVGTDTAELKALVRAFSKTLRKVDYRIKEKLLEATCKLLTLAASDSVAISLTATGALLILPGLIRHLQLVKQDAPKAFLKEVLASDNLAEAVIQRARITSQADDFLQAVVPPARDRTLPNAVARVESLVREGRLSTACRQLSEVKRVQDGTPRAVPLATEATVELIKQLNPSATGLDDYDAADLAAVHTKVAIQVTALEVEDTLLHLPRGSAAGWSGWSFYSIYALLVPTHEGRFEICASIAVLFNRMLKNECSSELWTPCRSVLIPKKDGNWRPLGIGDAWYRFLGRVISKKVSNKVGNRLEPLQLGAGNCGGCEIAARLPQVALDDMAGMAVISLDQRNAFNTMPRAMLLKGLLEHAPYLVKFFMFGHEHLIDLVYNGDVVWQNSTGLCQGYGPANIMYCCAYQAVLAEIKAVLDDRYSDLAVGVVAFCDDTNIYAPAECANAICEIVVEIFLRYSLPLAFNKCKIISNVGIIDPYFRVVTGALCMGAPTGESQYRRTEVASIVAAMQIDMDVLGAIGTVAAFTLLRRCINMRPGYLSRVSEWEYSQAPLADFDRAVDRALCIIMGEPLIHVLDEPIGALGEASLSLAWLRALPCRLSGLGMFRHSTLHGVKACLISRSICSCFIERHDLTIANGTSSWDDDLALGPCVVHRDDAAIRVPSGPESPVTSDGLKALVLAIQENSHSVLHNKLIITGRASEAATFKSSAFKGSGAFLSGLVRVGKNSFFTNSQFKAALRQRCFLPVFSDCSRVMCACGTTFDADEPQHYLDCKTQNRYFAIKRHDAVRDAVASFVKKCIPAAVVNMEPRVGVEVDHRRADIVIIHENRSMTIDVAVCNPAAVCFREAAPSSIRVADSASHTSEIMKRGSYVAMGFITAGVDANFTAFVVESTGRLGKDAMAYVNRVGGAGNKDEVNELIVSIGAITAYFNAQLLICLREKSKPFPIVPIVPIVPFVNIVV